MSPLLQPAWSAFLSSGWNDSDAFEGYTAAVAFVFWIALFKLMAWSSLCRYRFKNAAPPGYGVLSASDAFSAASLPVYLLAVRGLHLLKVRQRPRDEATAPTLLRLAVELVVGIVGYDAIFWCVHVALHRSERLYAAVHRRHHTHRCLEPGSTVSHSLLDGALQVGVNIAVQHLSPWGVGNKHPSLAITELVA